jgi:hypothetical protein
MHGEKFPVSHFSNCVKKKKLGPDRTLRHQKIRAAKTMDMEQTRAERNVMLDTNPMWASSPQGMRHAAFSRGAALRFLITQRQESEWVSFFLYRRNRSGLPNSTVA